jgi:HlyD family secretion protein
LKKKILIAVFVFLLIGGGVLVYVGRQSSHPDDLFFSGTIEATEAHLSFQTPGRVAAVYVQEGQDVRQNALVAELDRAEYQARVEQAKANLERARQAKKQAEVVFATYSKTLPAEVSRARAGVKTAQDQLADARKNYRRYEALFRQEVVTEKEHDAMKLAYDVAQSRLAEAESLLELALGNLSKIDVARQDIETAAAQAAQARAVLEQAEIQLGYTRLTSPIGGVIISRSIEPGETVNAGREVLSVADLTRVELKIFVPETQIGKVKPGQPAEVKIDSLPDKIFTGTVAFISPEGEFTPKIIQTQKERVKLVYRVKISIDNPRRELKAGMPADARLK